MRNLRSSLFSMPITVMTLCAATSSCFISEYRETETSPSSKTNPDSKSKPALSYLADQCSDEEQSKEVSPEDKAKPCYQKLDTVWRPSCRSNECQEVPVYVNYLLKEDLGGASTVNVEAFDNPNFVGAPISTVRVSHFNTSRPGTYERTSVWLDPGAYYLRAFVSDDDSKTVPYQYQQLQLVSERPVGVFGALSSPSSLTVKPRRVSKNPDPVHIVIDKLFRDPNAKIDTNAHLRVAFTVPDCAPTVTPPAGEPAGGTPPVVNCTPVPQSRTLIVRLFEDDDILRAPLASFTMPSEAFMVSSRPGKADLLSPALALGRYIVFAFIDENSNQFYDEGELAQIYSRFNAPAMVTIEANRTAELSLTLQRNVLRTIQ